MKLSLTRFLILCSLLSFPGLGLAIGGGGPESTQIPLPLKNFNATVVDVADQSVVARRISLEGKIFIQGKVGKASVSVPFEKIERLSVATGDDPLKVQVNVTLKNGSAVRLVTESTLKAFAETDFGNYEILLGDIRSVQFQ